MGCYGEVDKSSSPLSTPFKNFVKAETTSGAVLLLFAILAILLANSQFAEEFFSIWNTNIFFQVGDLKFQKPIHLFINECLMTLFFLVVGLEIKRELVVGELSSVKLALLPFLAALGGVIFPSLLFLAIVGPGRFESGWAIPTSTDIAFCLAALHILGDRIPTGLKVFTVAAAIVDDLFGVVILAVFYSNEIVLTKVFWALLLLLLLVLANARNVRKPLIYMVLGGLMWSALMSAGLHASVAGVILALFVPVRPAIEPDQFKRKLVSYVQEFEDAAHIQSMEQANLRRKSAILAIERASIKVQSPLQRLEGLFHPWVAFLVLPLFALCNAGVSFSVVDSLLPNITLVLAIFMGLVVGKPLGITLFGYLAVRSGIATLPQGVSFKHIASVGALSGIGFTMSLFISSLAFSDTEIVGLSRFSILLGSIVAWIIGTLSLLCTTGSFETRAIKDTTNCSKLSKEVAISEVP